MAQRIGKYSSRIQNLLANLAKKLTSLSNEYSSDMTSAKLRHRASVATERGFSLMNIICTRVKNSFTVDHISDLMTENY